jgi:hypothetical protein
MLITVPEPGHYRIDLASRIPTGLFSMPSVSAMEKGSFGCSRANGAKAESFVRPLLEAARS